MKTCWMDLGGKKKQVHYEVVKGTVWLHVDGETYSFAKKQRKAKSRAGQGGTPGKIEAPMPGKIVKIAVKNGQAVKSGQLVAVLEAMKMEYTLKSNIDGTVENIDCAAGDQVKAGKLLVSIKASGDPTDVG